MNRWLNRPAYFSWQCGGSFNRRFFGQVLGFVRTQIINANYLRHITADTISRFKIPDFFYTIAAGALGEPCLLADVAKAIAGRSANLLGY
jgi:hypothetical protein